MISQNELRTLISRAEDAGATTMVDFDAEAFQSEGREIIEFVTVFGLRGVGQFPMPPLTAAERIRAALAA